MRNPIRRSSKTVSIPRVSLSLNNESLYGLWTTHCVVNNLENGLDQDLNPKLMARSIFGPLTDLECQLAELARILEKSQAEIKKLRGVDISGSGSEMRALHQGLRYCRTCLDLGYHSIVYQHVGLAQCPLHATPFQDICPICKNVIKVTFASALAHPFECPNCQTSLARTAYRPQDRQLATLADQMAGGRRTVLASSSAASRHRLYFDDRPSTVQAHCAPTTSRHYQRVTVWAEPGDPHWITFPEERLCIVPRHTRGEVNGADSLDLGLAAERVLIWFKYKCQSHANAALRLAQRLGRYPRGLRINAHASVIATALYKVVSAYDLVQEAQTIHDMGLQNTNAKAIACYGKTMPRYGPDEPDFPELNFRLMQLEMLGMFAKILVMLKGQSPLSEVSWLVLPHPVEFAPTWLLKKTPSGVFVRIRARVNEKTLARLIQRRWADQLVYVSKDPISYGDFWRDNQLDTVWHEKRGMDLELSLSGKSSEIREPIQFKDKFGIRKFRV